MKKLIINTGIFDINVGELILITPLSFGIILEKYGQNLPFDVPELNDFCTFQDNKMLICLNKEGDCYVEEIPKPLSSYYLKHKDLIGSSLKR